MNKNKLTATVASGLEKTLEHLQTEEGKRLTNALNVTAISLSFTFAGSRGLRKICRRFGVELTRKEAYGLIVSGAAIVTALDPSKAERIKRSLFKPEAETKPSYVVNNRLN